MRKTMTDFKTAWESVPPSIQRKIREAVKTKCGLRSDYQFNDRKTGRVRIREYEEKQILEAFALYGVDAHTGKTLESVNN